MHAATRVIFIQINDTSGLIIRRRRGILMKILRRRAQNAHIKFSGRVICATGGETESETEKERARMRDRVA